MGHISGKRRPEAFDQYYVITVNGGILAGQASAESDQRPPIVGLDWSDDGDSRL